MADTLPAALAEIRERHEVTFDDPAGRGRPDLLLAVKVARDDVPRLLAALDAVLKEVHREGERVLHAHACRAHLGEGFQADCRDCPPEVRTRICAACKDQFGDELPIEDCRARKVILAALTGKGKADG